jgi:hypothetical protein
MAFPQTPPDEPDRPLPASDPFHQELRLLLAPRVNPAEAPGPPGNPAVDGAALARATLVWRSILG